MTHHRLVLLDPARTARSRAPPARRGRGRPAGSPTSTQLAVGVPQRDRRPGAGVQLEVPAARARAAARPGRPASGGRRARRSTARRRARHTPARPGAAPTRGTRRSCRPRPCPSRLARSRLGVAVQRSCAKPRNHCWCRSSAMGQPCAAPWPGGNGWPAQAAQAPAGPAGARRRSRGRCRAAGPRALSEYIPSVQTPASRDRPRVRYAVTASPRPGPAVGRVDGDPGEDRVAGDARLAHAAGDQAAPVVADPDPVLVRGARRAGRRCAGWPPRAARGWSGWSAAVRGTRRSSPATRGGRCVGAQPLPLVAVPEGQVPGDASAETRAAPSPSVERRRGSGLGSTSDADEDVDVRGRPHDEQARRACGCGGGGRTPRRAAARPSR